MSSIHLYSFFWNPHTFYLICHHFFYKFQVCQAKIYLGFLSLHSMALTFVKFVCTVGIPPLHFRYISTETMVRCSENILHEDIEQCLFYLQNKPLIDKSSSTEVVCIAPYSSKPWSAISKVSIDYSVFLIPFHSI